MYPRIVLLENTVHFPPQPAQIHEHKFGPFDPHYLKTGIADIFNNSRWLVTHGARVQARGTVPVTPFCINIDTKKGTWLPETVYATKSDEPASLNKKKSILKSQLTRFEKYLNTPEKVENKVQVEIRLKKIETAFEEFEKIQTQLEILEEGEDDTRDEMENRYYEAIAKAKTIVKEQIQQVPQVSQLDLNSLSLELASGVKIPAIRLPMFSGDTQGWISFHDTYKRLIHDKANLKNVEKLLHLKTCLKDNAFKVIAHLETTDDNYEIAWNLLKERFENKAVIINNHIRAILNLPKLTKSSPAALRDLSDNIHTHVSALAKLGLETKGWELVLICIITAKLDNVTELAWEETQELNELPTYENFKKFLAKRCFSLEKNANAYQAVSDTNNKNISKSGFQGHGHSKPVATFAVTENNENISGNISCQYCKADHYIYRCPEFLRLSLENKYQTIKNLRLCTNCLRSGNHTSDTASTSNQRVSSQAPGLSTNFVQRAATTQSADTVAQGQKPVSIKTEAVTDSNTNESSQILQAVEGLARHNNKLVLLSTAQILIHDRRGAIYTCRAILDSGSQSNLITRNLCDKLNLEKQEICIPITGVNQTITNITQKTKALIKSRTSGFRAELSFLVIPKITEKIPAFDFDVSSLNTHEHVTLADPDFNKAQDVDLLLGADIFYELLCPKQVRLGRNQPILQETALGWILTGSVSFANQGTRHDKNMLICNFSRRLESDISNETLDNALTKFWKLEEIPEQRYLSPEAQLAENYYQTTTTRDSQGRFIVRLPFLTNPSDYGIYTLNTVTYGTACAPFLSTRTLYELATQFEEKFPRTCKIIKTSFYMDDLLVSLDSIQEALEVYKELTEIFKSAGFFLRKWSSNNSHILANILDNKPNDDKLVEFHDNKELKTLGIAWNSAIDVLSYSVNLKEQTKPATKRSVLATVSKIFDPLGLVGPTIVRAKLFMQHLWREKLDWDEQLPADIQIWWLEFLTQLHCVNDISVARQVVCDDPQSIELHGFSDASERAYGASIYLVAPQNKCTLPRLELLAATLLAKLATIVEKTLNIELASTHYYSDSTVTLSWLRIDPSKLKTFIANRVSKINELTNIDNWKHVPSEHNPADVISRGMSPQELNECSLWWHGPMFLVENSEHTESFFDFTPIYDLPELKAPLVLVTTQNNFDLFDKFSSLTRLQHVICYCLRFKKRTLNKEVSESMLIQMDQGVPVLRIQNLNYFVVV
ncbi:hypothetical protein NQ315_006037 [Exocentrus adspersus]|uniref:Reverse transcriptase domain-containing protein n=1 Tax=Exocentrus adspersus TaxID=1586481 RepID=A0AAV8VG00_9CUCU|nr:hypothetical protein NQ315_006037 [Exocentrus adspersus]